MFLDFHFHAIKFSNGVDLFDINLTTEMPVEERVRVLIDPKPPKKGRLTYDEYYDRMVVSYFWMFGETLSES